MSNSFSRYSRPGPNAKLRFPLTEEEINQLGDLDNFYGASSHQEAAAALSESRLAVFGLPERARSGHAEHRDRPHVPAPRTGAHECSWDRR